MRRSLKMGAAGLMLAGFLSSLPAAHAASPVTIDSPAPRPRVATDTIQLLDCQGGTGVYGCGAGFFWRDGWRGFGCYPC